MTSYMNSKIVWKALSSITKSISLNSRPAHLVYSGLGRTGLTNDLAQHLEISRRQFSVSCARKKLSTAKTPSVNIEDNCIRIRWPGDIDATYLNVWLRDHCRCPECFHQTTKQRLLNTFEIPPSIKIRNVESSREGLRVIWSKDVKPHESFYPWYWLKVNHNNSSLGHARKKLWGTELSGSRPEVQYQAVMNMDVALWKFLQLIDSYGVCFINGVPVTTDATEQLALRISRIRHTQYGGFWDFTSDLAKGDTAYTTLALGAHTDTTYFTDPCGLQLFHLLSHTGGDGGQTLLVDGFRAADQLRAHHAAAYKALASVRVPTHAAGEPNEFFRPTPTAGYPILNCDPLSGELYQVRYNNDDRSAIRGLSIEELEKWYESLRLWDKALKSPEAEYWVQLKPGTAVVVDNHRVLHGRSAFTGKRRMCGAYIGMDDFRSRLLSLSEKFNDGAENKSKRDNWSELF